MLPVLNRFAPPVLVYTLIFYLSSRPASSFPKLVPDIVPHFIEYFILSYFFARMFLYNKKNHKKSPDNNPLLSKTLNKTIIACFLILFVLAFLDELHQYYVPSRFFELKDLFVDSIGIITGVMVWKLKGGPY